jgi:hypothetical protein
MGVLYFRFIIVIERMLLKEKPFETKIDHMSTYLKKREGQSIAIDGFDKKRQKIKLYDGISCY